MATVRELIAGSLRLLGVIQSGEGIPAEEAQDGLTVLNELLDEWNATGLAIHQVSEANYSVTIGQGTYLLGATETAPNWTGPRPSKIVAAGWVVGTQERPLQIITPQDWQSVTLKNLAGSIPVGIYPAGSMPSETIYVWPVPSSAGSVKLYTWKPLASFATVDDAVSLPPGYLKALRFNLAVALAPEYGIQVQPAVAMGAQESLAQVKRQNTDIPKLGMDVGVVTGSRHSPRVEFMGGV